MSKSLIGRKRKLKNTCFEAYYILSQRTFVPASVTRAFLIFLIIIEHLQYLSFIIFTGFSIGFYKDSVYLSTILPYSRLDIKLADLIGIDATLILILGILSGNLFGKLCIMLGIYFKISKLTYFKILVKFSGYLIIHIMKIPILRLALRFGFGYNDYVVDYSKVNTSQTSMPRETYICCLTLLIIILIPDILFTNLPKYSQKNLNRTSCHIQIKELISLFLMQFLSPIFEIKISLTCFSIISVFMSFSYYHYLPYFNTKINKFYLQLWNSVLILSILLIISDIFDNFFIAEFVFPFIYVSSIFMMNELFQKRLKNILNETKPNNPFIYELIARFKLFSGDMDMSLSEIFKESTINFTDFKLQYIWESEITLKFYKNKKLALKKLSKIDLSSYKNKKDGDGLGAGLKDFINIEVEFYEYCLHRKIINESFEGYKDITMIKYLIYLNKFKSNESRNLSNLSKLLLLLNNPDSPISLLQQTIESLGSKILKNHIFYQKSIKKFGSRTQFQELYKSFCSEILNKDQNFENSTNLHSSKTQFKIISNKFINENEILLLISGNSNDLGTILYASQDACKLCNYNSLDEMIGMSFTELIPPPFDKIHKDVLVKFIMFSNLTELQRSHFVILDKFSHCIEVTMDLNLVFYKGNTVFLIKFYEMKPSKNLILVGDNWEICGFSENIQKILGNVQSNLLILLPNILELFSIYSENEIFLYECSEKSFLIRRNTLTVGRQQLLVIYIDVASSIKALDYYESLFVQSPKTLEYLPEELKIDPDSKSNKSAFGPSKNSEKLIKSTGKLKIFNVTLIFFIILMLIILLCIIFILQKFSESTVAFTMISEIGLMRFLSASSLANIQSLDLIYHNYTVLNQEDFYRNALKESMKNLNFFLKKYKKISLPLKAGKRFYFQDELIRVSFSKTDAQYLNLFDFIKTYIKYSLNIANQKLENFDNISDHFDFVYYNIPYGYMKKLNDTVFEVMRDLILSQKKMFYTIFYCEIAIIAIPIILLLFSIFYLKSLEKLNKSLSIQIKNTKNLNEKYKKINKRLEDLHKIKSNHDAPLSLPKRDLHQKNIILPFLLRISFLFLISIGVAFNSFYGYHIRLHEILDENLIHMNFGGLRRMMSPLTLYWTRSTYMQMNQKDFFSHSNQSIIIKPAQVSLSGMLEDYKSIQTDLMKHLSRYPLRDFQLNDYKNLMFGSSCDYLLNITNCSRTIVSCGVHSGFLTYLFEIKRLIYSNQVFNMTNVNLIEKYTYNVGLSFVYGLRIFYSDIKVVVDFCLAQSKIAYLAFFSVILVYYLIVARKISEKIWRKFECLDVVGKIIN